MEYWRQNPYLSPSMPYSTHTDTESQAEQLARRPDAEELVDSIKTRLDAERRRRADYYEWLDEDKKAEFIEGEIFVHSPVVKRHADATKLLTKLLDTHVEQEALGYVATEKLLVRLRRDDFEPDVAFWRTQVADAFTDDQLFFPAPDFVAEVLSPSTEDIDRTKKFRAYGQAGVREYWIVDSKARAVERYTLGNDGKYAPVDLVTGAGELTLATVAGFCVSATALFDARENLRVLREMLR